MKIRTLCIISTCILLAGCATDSKKFVNLNVRYTTTSNAPIDSIDRNAQAQLAESATAVTNSYQDVAAIDRATHPKVKLNVPIDAQSSPLAQSTSIDWNGPVEPLLQQVARAAHYQLRVIGKPPAVAVIVAIHQQHQTLASVLRDAAYQTVHQASVVINDRNRIIELRYYRA